MKNALLLLAIACLACRITVIEPEVVIPTPAEYAIPMPKRAVEPAYCVTAANVRLRDGPGTGFQELTILHKGDAVIVYGAENGWAAVDFERGPMQYRGYVNSVYIEDCR